MHWISQYVHHGEKTKAFEPGLSKECVDGLFRNTRGRGSETTEALSECSFASHDFEEQIPQEYVKAIEHAMEKPKNQVTIQIVHLYVASHREQSQSKKKTP